MNLDVSLYRTRDKPKIVTMGDGCRTLRGEYPVAKPASKVQFDGIGYLNDVTDVKVTDVAELDRLEQFADKLASEIDDTVSQLSNEIENPSDVEGAKPDREADAHGVGIPAASFPVPKSATHVDRSGDLENIMYRTSMSMTGTVRVFIKGTGIILPTQDEEEY